MARDVEADIVLNDKTDKGARSAAQSLKAVDKAAKDAQHSLDGAAKSTEKLGKSSNSNSQGIAKLSHEIGLAKNELGSLAKAFTQTDNAAQRIDITKAMRRQTQEISRLTKNKGILEALEPDRTTIQKFGDNLGKSLSQSVKDGISAEGSVGPAIAGAVIPFLPLIGGAISAAVIGGASIGGVVGGIALASRDVRVKSAASSLKTVISGTLNDNAGVFVKPTVQAIDTIQAKFEQLRPQIKSIFSNSSQYVAPLAHGISEALGGITEGVSNLVANGGPVIASLSAGIDKFGKTVGDGLTRISQDGPAAASALDDIFNAADHATTATLGVVDFFSKIKGGFDDLDNTIDKSRYKLEDALSIGDNPGAQFDITADGMSNIERRAKQASESTGKFSKVIRGAAQISRDASGNFDEFGNAITTAGEAIPTLTDKLNNLYNVEHGVFDANTDAAASFDDLKQSIKENGKTLDIHTAKGRANRTALSQLASALNKTVSASIDANDAQSKTNKIASQNYSSFVKAARGLGLSTAAAKKYASQLGLIPPQKTTKIYANTHDAAGRIAALKGQLNGIQSKSIAIAVAVHVENLRNKVNSQLGAAAYYSAAGSTFAATPASNLNTTLATKVNEEAPVFDNYITLNVPGVASVNYVQRSQARQERKARVGRRS